MNSRGLPFFHHVRRGHLLKWGVCVAALMSNGALPARAADESTNPGPQTGVATTAQAGDTTSSDAKSGSDVKTDGDTRQNSDKSTSPPASQTQVVSVSDSNVFTLGEIGVSVTDDEDPFVNGNVVSQDDIRTFDRSNVAEAVRLLPGVALSRFGARSEQTVSVRGFSLTQVPVMIDGIPVYVPYDGYVDLGRFTTADLSEIQVSKGISSVLAGPSTLGGAINLVSRRPTKRVEAEAMTGIRIDSDGVREGFEASASTGMNLGTWYAQASLNQLERDHIRPSSDFAGNDYQPVGGDLNNSYADDIKFNTKIGYTPGNDEYALNFIYQHGKKGTPTCGSTDCSSNRYWIWPYWDKQSVYWLSNTELADGKAYLKTRLYYDIFKNSLYSYDDQTYSTQNRGYSFRSWYDDYTVGGSAELGGDVFKDDTLKGAIHYKEDHHAEHNDGDPQQDFSDFTWSVGLENTYAIHDRLRLITGASFDRKETKEAEDYENDQLFDYTMHDDQAFNPMASLVWDMTETGQAHVSIARKTRFPTIKERYSYRLGTAEPNPSLRPEKADHFEVGVSQTFGQTLHVDASIFNTELNDAIQTVTLSSGLTQNQNVASETRRGVELSARWTASDTLDIGGNYTGMRARSNDDDAVKITDAPHHQLFLYAEWRPTSAVRLVPSVEYASSRYLDTGGQRNQGYVLADINAFWNVTDWITAEAGVSNIGDVDYELSSGYPEEGRVYHARVRVTY